MKASGLEYAIATRKRLWFLDQLIYSQGLTKRQVALLLNRSPQSITYIFNEDNCKLSFIENLCRILGFVTTIQIVERGKSQPKPVILDYDDPKRSRLSFLNDAIKASKMPLKEILRKSHISKTSFEHFYETGDISIDKIYRIADAMGGMVCITIQRTDHPKNSLCLNHKVSCLLEMTPVNQ